MFKTILNTFIILLAKTLLLPMLVCLHLFLEVLHQAQISLLPGETFLNYRLTSLQYHINVEVTILVFWIKL